MGKKFVHHYKWSSEMDSTLKELYGTYSAKEICSIINEKYGTNFSYTAIYNRARDIKLSDSSLYHKWTNEQNEWLKENSSKYTYSDLAKELNDKFNTNIGYYALKSHCSKTLKLISGNPSAKGYRNGKSVPIGYERIGKNGRIVVKVSNLPTTRGMKDRGLNWMDKGRYVWEQHYGEIPKGYNIIYLDGNPLNCDISNLECASNDIQGCVTQLFKGCTPQLKRCAVKTKTLDKIIENLSIKEMGV